MTSDEAQAVMLHLVAAFPSPPIPDLTMALYLAELTELEFVAAYEAIRRLSRECQWFPKLVEVHEAYQLERLRGMRGGPTALALDDPTDYGAEAQKGIAFVRDALKRVSDAMEERARDLDP